MLSLGGSNQQATSKKKDFQSILPDKQSNQATNKQGFKR